MMSVIRRWVWVRWTLTQRVPLAGARGVDEGSREGNGPFCG
ncbi:hypothetical protein BX286_6380 [Streptomyces sp. 3211.6]|nr:hypothetical protein BX286_6380 [Streptomyces sp. 3211.6]RPF29688.1 hypothetical protein EDD96_6225 [Streptomyces sp. Ag109_G2-6]